ncbi:MAG: AAA family ATPase [Deltaproteobacteria bacterium]|nr:AAA family ATPase [Deltaproteobacteria bacterium]
MKRHAMPPPSTPPLAPIAHPKPGPFPYRDWVAARSQIESALRQGPFYGLVIGGSGTGKTSLVRELSGSLDRHQYQLLYLSSPRISLISIVRFFALALRVSPKRSSLETIKSIADVIASQPARLVAWIDEATAIPVDTLVELRSLTEFSHEVPQIFSVVLAGPPELKTLLDNPALFPLRRRIGVRCTLEGLHRDELDAFLLHRFGSVDDKRLPQGLRDELFERARGIPALLDRAVRHALDRAGSGSVSSDHLREALDATAL